MFAIAIRTYLPKDAKCQSSDGALPANKTQNENLTASEYDNSYIFTKFPINNVSTSLSLDGGFADPISSPL